MIRRRARGFTLVEALVAMAVATVTVAGFYSAVGTGARLERAAEDQAANVLLASQILDRTGVDIPLRAGVFEEGQVGPRRWRLTITGGVQRDMDLGRIPAGHLLTVAVTVTGQGPDVTLRSLRYATSPL